MGIWPTGITHLKEVLETAGFSKIDLNNAGFESDLTDPPPEFKSAVEKFAAEHVELSINPAEKSDKVSRLKMIKENFPAVEVYQIL